MGTRSSTGPLGSSCGVEKLTNAFEIYLWRSGIRFMPSPFDVIHPWFRPMAVLQSPLVFVEVVLAWEVLPGSDLSAAATFEYVAAIRCVDP